MVDIKVGDWVKLQSWVKFYEVVESEGNNITVLNSWGKRYSYSLEDYDFIIRENPTPSPVREVVTKELVAGTYGNLTIYYAHGKEKVVDNLRIEVTTSVHTPKQLRDMAKTLNEVAEFLEGE